MTRSGGRRVELELERRTLERLAGLAGTPSLDPVCAHFVRPARSVGDAAVKRLYRQPALRALADQRVEAPAEPIHLDDVARPDSLESHRRKRTREPGGSPAAHLVAPAAVAQSPSTPPFTGITIRLQVTGEMSRLAIARRMFDA